MPSIALKWTISGLATELDMDRRTLSKLLKRVAPAETKTEVGRMVHYYFMSDVVKLMIEGAYTTVDDPEAKLFNPQQIKAALDDERRRKVELERMELEGLLCRRDDVIQEITTMIHSAKSKLRGLPSKCLHQIMAASDYETALPVMTRAIDEALDELGDEISG